MRRTKGKTTLEQMTIDDLNVPKVEVVVPVIENEELTVAPTLNTMFNYILDSGTSLEMLVATARKFLGILWRNYRNQETEESYRTYLIHEKMFSELGLYIDYIRYSKSKTDLHKFGRIRDISVNYKNGNTNPTLMSNTPINRTITHNQRMVNELGHQYFKGFTCVNDSLKASGVIYSFALCNKLKEARFSVRKEDKSQTTWDAKSCRIILDVNNSLSLSDLFN